MTARHLIIHGRVQGVFHRDWTVATARSLGLVGWVRNLRDGTVEAHLEGEHETIERMIGAMRDGPPHAAVTHIEQSEVAAEGHTRFARR